MNFIVLHEPSHSTWQTIKTPHQCENMADIRAEIDRLARQVGTPHCSIPTSTIFIALRTIL